jgi:hypothetical protein
VHRVSAVVGGEFVVQGGESFGKIEDIVISDTGCIEYVVVVHEDHYIPIPWTIVDVDFGDRVVVAVDITGDRLLEAPWFGGWAEFSKTEWREKTSKHFSSETRRDRGRDRGRDEVREGREDRRDPPRAKREAGEGSESRPRARDDQGKSDTAKPKPNPKKSDEKKSDEGKPDPKKPS